MVYQSKERILEDAIQQIGELTLENSEELFADSKKLVKDSIQESSEDVDRILGKLSECERKIISDYLDKIAILADYEGLCHYEQGAKDCVALLKRLGVISNP